MKQLGKYTMICKKMGMSQIYDKNGWVIPVTIIHVEKNYILNLRKNTDYLSVQIAAYDQKEQRLSKSIKGLFEKVQIKPKKKIKEFKFTLQNTYKVGDMLSIDNFKVGQFVDVIGITIGKGFAGGMKRHNFSGLEASHGVSINHRSSGSTGQCQDPGKVFKGKKMAGHLGSVRRTTQGLRIVDIDKDLELLIVKGSVPGHKNNYVYVRDSIKKVSVF